MRLIDADELLERMMKTSRYFMVKFDIEESPTIEERKRGWWECVRYVRRVAHCSNCGHELRGDCTPFCPNCGAEMEGVRWI